MALACSLINLLLDSFLGILSKGAWATPDSFLLIFFRTAVVFLHKIQYV